MTGKVLREEPLGEVAYLYDGTLEGVLSAVFEAFARHEDPSDIVGVGAYQPRIGQSALVIETDEGKAARVRRGIESHAGRQAFVAVARASTCDDYDAGLIILRFVRRVMAREAHRRGYPILDQLADPAVADVVRLSRSAANECEKMRQFIRFSQMENGVWFARCNPKASVVPLVMGYFADRLNDQPFVIFDEVHDVAGIYDGKRWELVREAALAEGGMPKPAQRDFYLQEAWKRFYDAVSNDARYNPELRRSFMPVRLWRNLSEMQPRRQVSPGALCYNTDDSPAWLNGRATDL